MARIGIGIGIVKKCFIRPQILAWEWKTRFDDAANDHGKKHVEK